MDARFTARMQRAIERGGEGRGNRPPCAGMVSPTPATNATVTDAAPSIVVPGSVLLTLAVDVMAALEWLRSRRR